MKKLIVALVFVLGCGGVEPLVQSYEPPDAGPGRSQPIDPLLPPGIPNTVVSPADSGLIASTDAGAPAADAGSVEVDAGQPVVDAGEPSDAGCPEDNDKDDKKAHHPNHDPRCEKH